MRIVISGTYCTGKTTTALALSLATGIPHTHALTMREILPEMFPGKKLKDCRFHELMALGMKRFEERIRAEAKLGGHFISDGCCLQEWLYGSTRLITGVDPSEKPWRIRLKQMLRPLEWKLFRQSIKSFEGVVKTYAQTHYDHFFHLPLAFPFVSDGHRPTSEHFREVSEQRLIKAYDELDMKIVTVHGSLEARLEQLLAYLKIEPVCPIKEAVALATQQRKAHFDTVPLEQPKT